MASATALIPNRPTLIPIITPDTPSGVTVGQLCKLFMASKRKRHADGELSIKTIEDYDYAARLLVDSIGGDVPVAAMRPLHFAALRSVIARKRGLRGEAKTIQCIRTLFKFAVDMELVSQQPRFDSDFKRPPARLFRKAKRERGSMMIEAEQFRRLIDLAKPKMRAMLLLALNCGFGPADLSNLTFEAIDLQNGWVTLPRSKTWIDRKCPLWPETVEAVDMWLLKREPPKKTENERFVFLTWFGSRVCNSRGKFVLSRAFKSMFRKAGVSSPYVGIYSCRRAFETIASESLNQVAVDFVMGHAPAFADMASVYRQRISDERLQRVVEHVRGWVWPTLPLTINEQRQQSAEEISELWESKPLLSGADVLAAIDALRINQTELAAGVGYCLDWVNKLILGKNAISTEADARFRRFFEQRSGRLKELAAMVEGGANV